MVTKLDGTVMFLRNLYFFSNCFSYLYWIMVVILETFYLGLSYSLHEMRKNGKRTSPKILTCSDPRFSAYGTVPYSIQAKNWKSVWFSFLKNFSYLGEIVSFFRVSHDGNRFLFLSSQCAQRLLTALLDRAALMTCNALLCWVFERRAGSPPWSANWLLPCTKALAALKHQVFLDIVPAAVAKPG